MARQINEIIKNFARGGGSYRVLRLKIAEAITSQSDHVLSLGDFLGRKLFDISIDTWVNLSLTDRDWTFIARLRGDGGERFDKSYLTLALGYVEANAERVRALYETEAKVSQLLLDDGPDAADAERMKLASKDQQSLFASRLACALHHASKDELVEFFSGVHYSAWLRKRFLYPFIYFFINRPPDEFLDDHLSHVLPPGYGNAQERAVIEFLLRDEIAYDETLSFKCYVALATHPYDASEILLDHCEAVYAMNGALGESEMAIVRSLASIVPETRKQLLPTLFGREYCTLSLRAKIDRWNSGAFEYEQFGDLIGRLLGSEVSNAERPLPKNSLSAAAVRLRQTRYPRVQDYDHVVAFARSFWFTAAGRLLGAYVTSLFLLPRRERQFELREVFRLAGICDGLVPLLLTAPRCSENLLLRRPETTESRLKSYLDLLEGAETRSDRVWINKIHFQLSHLERAGYFRQWLQHVFESLPVAPAYLTGIDWKWFMDMVRLVRIGPFRGSPSGIYVLLLQHIEGRRKETNTLRIAVEEVARDAKNLARFLEWCFEAFGDRSVALVRYFLSADMILWLGLEPNFVAALSGRIRAIEACARKYGLGPLLTEETLVQEERIYTAALLAINVGANQFEISWDVLKKDVGLAQGDVFNAYLAFNVDGSSGALLTLAKQASDHYFALGQAAKYTIVNRDWPLLNVVAGIIDAFMEHPTQGIESILAIRIRHNMLRREFLSVVDQIKRLHIPGVLGSERQFVVPMFEATIGRVVQSWIDKYMHQRRVGHEHAVFDFVPSQEDVEVLLGCCKGHSTFIQTFDVVSGWILTRLDAQLSQARHLLTKELRAALETAIDSRVTEIESEVPHV